MGPLGGPWPPLGSQNGPRDTGDRFKIPPKKIRNMGWKCQLSATALARTAFLILRRRRPTFTLLTFPQIPPSPQILSSLGGRKSSERRPPPGTSAYTPPDGLKTLQDASMTPPTRFNGPPKINLFDFRTSKIQYFLSPDHCNSIFSLSRALEFNIFFLQSTKIQYFLFRITKI